MIYVRIVLTVCTAAVISRGMAQNTTKTMAAQLTLFAVLAATRSRLPADDQHAQWRRANPLNRRRVITLNCGLGRDSIAMVCLCFEGNLWVNGLGIVLPSDLDAVVFSDTGAEWAHTYAMIEPIRELCRLHGVRFIVLEKGEAPLSTPSSWDEIEAKAQAGGYHVRPKRGGGVTTIPGIVEDYQSRATVASIAKGDCTERHKIDAIRRLINDIAVVRFGVGNRSWAAKSAARPQHITLIGIAADEKARLGNGGRGPNYVTEAYPLVDMHLAKADEVPILTRWDLNHVRKSGCYVCPFQPPSWYWALSVEAPETYAAVVEYEQIALARNPRMSVTGAKRKDKTPMTIPEVVSKWREANPAATTAAVLTKQYSRIACEARAAQAEELKNG